MNEVQEFLEKAHLGEYWPAFERDAITTIDRLCLISAKKAEELLPKWGDQAEFFNRRNALQASTSKNLVFDVEVDEFGNCSMPFVDVNTDNCLDIVNTPLRHLDNII
nr:PREDICTED: uncharacterized protein LOC105675638 [Linepithema humile]